MLILTHAPLDVPLLSDVGPIILKFRSRKCYAGSIKRRNQLCAGSIDGTSTCALSNADSEFQFVRL